MARTRNLKPGFFKNEDLAELPHGARLLFAGLWLLADCRGVLEDRPKRIKGELFPYENAPVAKWLDLLVEKDFCQRYTCSNTRCLLIVNFCKHQRPHPSEKPSSLPAPDSEESLFLTTSREKKEPASPSTLPPFHLSTLDSTEQSSEQPEPAESLPTTDGHTYFVTVDQVATWKDAYPGIDPLQEIKRAKAWLIANPKKAKTFRGMSRFLNSWMDRAQNRRGGQNDSGEWAAR